MNWNLTIYAIINDFEDALASCVEIGYANQRDESRQACTWFTNLLKSIESNDTVIDGALFKTEFFSHERLEKPLFRELFCRVLRFL